MPQSFLTLASADGAQASPSSGMANTAAESEPTVLSFFDTHRDHAMKPTSLIGLSLALAMGTSALAQGHSPQPRAAQNQQDCRNTAAHCAGPAQRQMPHQNSQRPQQAPGQARHNDFDRAPPHAMPPYQAQPNQRGAGPNHAFHRGARLPAEYRSRQYVVSDWRGHRLSPPPRGYHWVQSGSDYLLVAVSTGIILQILLNN